MRLAFLLCCTVTLLCGAPPEKEWRSLFDGKSFSGWEDPSQRTPPGDGWAIEDGALMAKPKPRLREDLVSRDTFGDFEWEFEWKIAPGTNSGIKYLAQRVEFIDLSKVPNAGIDQQLAFEIEKNASDRSALPPDAKGKDYTIGFEFQLIDDSKNADAQSGGTHSCGALYSLIAPSAKPAKPAGQWNTAKVVVRGTHVEHWINGVKVLDASLTDPRVASGLEKRWGKEHPVYKLLTERPKKRNPLVITHHGDQAWFRNLRIREL